MAVRSLKDQIDSLLGRQVAKSKSDGVADPDGEARALFESIGLNLLLRPKAVLHVAHLARNGLLKVVTDEIALADALTKTLQDLGNPSFVVQGSKDLKKARTALLQMENLDKIDPENEAFKRFDNAVSDFLDKSISKMVRRPGATELLRPGPEALQDLPTDYELLKSKHEEMLSRLYALTVGVDNFLSTPLTTILGMETTYRARSDIESIIEAVDSKIAHQSARDIVNRLISARAALKAIGALPSLYDPLVSATLPKGHVLKAKSAPAKATIVSSVGPHALGGVTLQISTESSYADFEVPQDDFSLANKAFVYGTPITATPTLAPGLCLFITLRHSSGLDPAFVEGPVGVWRRSIKVTLPSGATTITAIVNAINTALSGVGGCARFATNTTDRLVIYANSEEISISDIHTEPETSGGNPGIPNIFTNSGHEAVGFTVGQSGKSFEASNASVAEAIRILWGTNDFIVHHNGDDTISLTTVRDTPGVYIGATAGPYSLTFSPQAYGQSAELTLYGEVFGVETNPVNPQALVDVGDIVTTPSGKVSIAEVDSSKITLASSVPTFDAVVTIESSLAVTIGQLFTKLKAFIETWLKNPHARGLSSLDRTMSILAGSQSPAHRNTAIGQLAALKTNLQTIKDLLSDAATVPAAGCATRERELVLGIVNTLSERKFDRAVELLLRCQIQELFELDHETASYGGALLKAMSTFAQTDIQFPNRNEDEGDVPNAKIEDGGSL